MNKIQFDSNGIFASTPELRSIALQVMEQEKRERELRRSLSDEDLNATWGTWNISDRHWSYHEAIFLHRPRRCCRHRIRRLP